MEDSLDPMFRGNKIQGISVMVGMIFCLLYKHVLNIEDERRGV